WFLPRLPERLLEALRQRITARFLGVDRLLEDGLAARGFLGENVLGFAELGLVAAIRFLVGDNASEVRVEDERGLTAGTNQLELRMQFGHQRFPPRYPATPPAGNCFFSSSGLPSGSFAATRTSTICILRNSHRCS